MTFTKIWQRYFLREILTTFFLLLLSFFILYALVDYSIHMEEITKNSSISIGDLLAYYGLLFSKRCDLILPLALLIATVKVLTSLNRQNELLALQNSGIALHRLTRPFFFVGLICTGLGYGNFEILTPRSLRYVDRFEQNYLKKKKSRKIKNEGVHTLFLEDGTRLLYQSYDPETKEFFDLFWILSIDEIYHMKTLKARDSDLIGTFIDYLKRVESGEMIKVSSYPSLTFNRLNLNFELQDYRTVPPENRSIRDLVAMTLNETPFFNRSVVRTQLYFKLFIPWLSIVVLIGVFPFCIPSVRLLPTFLIFSVTIFGYIAFFILIDGCILLGETAVLPPFWAIFTLPMLLSVITGVRFIKTCTR
ncbi:MAG: LptF/LptG family permease [Chlamydiota bacterium]